MTTAGEFRRRARFEADRYGGDAWVFVRELLQNSRDAGAHRVDFIAGRHDGFDRVICCDDGSGMSFEHAREFLFTLYASSKRGRGENAGRFGIGFWSILRFSPDEVIVRSAPTAGQRWEVRLSGDLENVDRRRTSLTAGTEIELRRRSGVEDPSIAVAHAVHRDARFLRRRGADDEALEIRVNSRPATAVFELPSPSLGFSRPGLRGAVALAAKPRVDLLAHGLRVRTAATLDELLTEPDRRRKKPPAMPEGLVPRVMLDSRRLQVMMARGDARTDRELHRLVELGRRGIRRLVRDELDREAGLGRVGRAVMRAREFVSSRRLRRAAVIIAGLALTTAGLAWLAGVRFAPDAGGTDSGAGLPIHAGARPETVLSSDLAERYPGPAANLLDRSPAAIALRYRPNTAKPMLAAFRVTAMDDDGRVLAEQSRSPGARYGGAVCETSCLDIELDLDVAPGRVRLPVPTGHLLDPTSVRTDGLSAELFAAPDGGPVLEIDRNYRGLVSYRTGAAWDGPAGTEGPWPALPSEAAARADGLRLSSADEAARLARDWVARRVAYDTSSITVERHRSAQRSGLGFAARCLTVGAGDCDVQNALLVAILNRAGVPARLAVGWVGSGGRAMPGLHAWVEYRGGAGSWKMVDASAGGHTNLLAEDPPGAGASRGRAPAAVAVSDSPMSRRAGWFGFAAPVVPVIAGLVLVLTFVWFAIRGRLVLRKVRPGGAPDLAGLIRGALVRPEAYGEVPALFWRRVVPLVGGGTINLGRARSLSKRGRLAVSFAASTLALRAAAANQPVIDGGRAEGEAVAAVLGAIDLDRWDRVLLDGQSHPVCDRLAGAAVTVGENWKVVVCEGAPGEVAVLEGRLAGLGRRQLLVAVDEHGELWQRLRPMSVELPATAALALAERVFDGFLWSPERRRRLLRQLAVEAVTERAERVS